MNILYIISAFFTGISVGSIIALIIYNQQNSSKSPMKWRKHNAKSIDSGR